MACPHPRHSRSVRRCPGLRSVRRTSKIIRADLQDPPSPDRLFVPPAAAGLLSPSLARPASCAPAKPALACDPSGLRPRKGGARHILFSFSPPPKVGERRLKRSVSLFLGVSMALVGFGGSRSLGSAWSGL